MLAHSADQHEILKLGPNTIDRHDTCREMLNLLLRHRVLHVRATPASGKSTLAKLLEEYLLRKTDLRVVLIGSWKKNDRLSWQQYLLAKIEDAGIEDVISKRSLLATLNLVFIIDEAQGSYSDEDFWNECVKCLSDGDDTAAMSAPMVVLLSSYGSASSGPVYADGSVPVKLSLSQSKSLKASTLCCLTAQVFFTAEEHLSLCSLLMANPVKRFRACPELVAYIFHLTDSHPGFTRTLWSLILSQPVYIFFPYFFDCSSGRLLTTLRFSF